MKQSNTRSDCSLCNISKTGRPSTPFQVGEWSDLEDWPESARDRCKYCWIIAHGVVKIFGAPGMATDNFSLRIRKPGGPMSNLLVRTRWSGSNSQLEEAFEFFDTKGERLH